MKWQFYYNVANTSSETNFTSKLKWRYCECPLHSLQIGAWQAETIAQGVDGCVTKYCIKPE
jgi:hypothetical protein